MTFVMLRTLYSILFILLLPIIFLRLITKSVKSPAYRHRWQERLGCSNHQLPNSIWVHAVSVGEAISAVPFVKALQKAYPHLPIVITTMTPTGSERVKAAFEKELNQTIFHVYVPYDVPFAIQNFLKRMTPKILILMETEIWPNMITECHKQKISIVIANARLSPKSLKHYQMGHVVVRPLMDKVTFIGAQSQMDADRFVEIGAKFDKVKNIGNIKFDISWPDEVIEKGKLLRTQLGEARQVLIAASTHEGEEEIILSVYQKLKSQFPDLILLLVPRHPPRFERVASLCEAKGLVIVKRTDGKLCLSETDVFLGDTMGEMGIFYAASDIAFVGGSFTPIGGHNLLEPAALGLPILTGPHLHNFVYISEVLLAANGAVLVENEGVLFKTLNSLLMDPKLCQELGQNALAVVAQNKGALKRLLTLVARML